MALDMYFREDIQRILGAVHIAGNGPIVALEPEVDTAQMQALRDIYQRGFEDALTAVGAAFEVVPARTLPGGRFVHTG